MDLIAKTADNYHGIIKKQYNTSILFFHFVCQKLLTPGLFLLDYFAIAHFGISPKTIAANAIIHN